MSACPRWSLSLPSMGTHGLQSTAPLLDCDGTRTSHRMSPWPVIFLP